MWNSRKKLVKSYTDTYRHISTPRIISIIPFCISFYCTCRSERIHLMNEVIWNETGNYIVKSDAAYTHTVLKRKDAFCNEGIPHAHATRNYTLDEIMCMRERERERKGEKKSAERMKKTTPAAEIRKYMAK